MSVATAILRGLQGLASQYHMLHSVAQPQVLCDRTLHNHSKNANWWLPSLSWKTDKISKRYSWIEVCHWNGNSILVKCSY